MVDSHRIEVRPGEFVLVDAVDAPLVMSRKWHIKTRATKSGRIYQYAACGKQGRHLLHRLITDPPPGFVVDHIDGDGLNNTRANLRVCTHAQNMRNRRPNIGKTLPKGVRRIGDSFCAEIKAGATRLRKRGFKTIEEAAAKYAEWSLMLHGEFSSIWPPIATPKRKKAG